MNRRALRIITILVTAILISIFSLYSRYHTVKSLPEGTVRVVEVYDGDTIGVMVKGSREKIRLIGIDAPEMGQQPWGRMAKEHLKKLLENSDRVVALEFDLQERDKYGRLLGYVTTPDGRMINLQMLKDGYAMLFTIPPNIRYIDEFRNAQREARRKGIGIWGREGLKETPRTYRKEHPRL
jgi:micrococcal nuclease